MYFLLNLDGITYTAAQLDALIAEAAAEHPHGIEVTLDRVAQRTGIERGLVGRYYLVNNDPNRDERGNWIGSVSNENGWTA